MRWLLLVALVTLVIGVMLAPVLGAAESAKGQSQQATASEPVPRSHVPPTGQATFVPIDPVRAFDSRVDAYPQSGTLAPNASKVIPVKDGHNSFGHPSQPNAVPMGATAVSYNVTITAATGPNFVAVTPGDAASFSTSAINFDGESDVANAGIVTLDGARQLKVWNGIESGTVHFIIDITGYFLPPLFAYVASDGTLRHGSGVTSVTKVSTGQYRVEFTRDVGPSTTGCTMSATIGGPLGEAAGVIDTAVSFAADTVTVFTQNTSGSLSDRGFHLIIVC